MNVTYEQYEQMYKKASRNSASALNTLKAFLIGGSICLAGQGLGELYRGLGLSEKTASAAVSVSLILTSVVLTAFGLYARLAKHGGAGTLVPITGFANAVAAPAIEYKTEGLITGVGVKIFTVAGPVILYGTLAASVYGAVLFLMRLTA
ncbi:MAG: SpoVA/SpoVAEb family sporulation membrane protein [Ruminococcus sp.]|nr:SpoVA/SpoVAEb family sporulation membrane protein [Ruminococcus sp.]